MKRLKRFWVRLSLCGLISDKEKRVCISNCLLRILELFGRSSSRNASFSYRHPRSTSCPSCVPALFVCLVGFVGPLGLVLGGCELVSEDERRDLPRSWFSYCGYVSDWDPDWVAIEDAVIEEINAARSRTQDCGSRGIFPPAPPLEPREALTCAARNHSYDMATEDYFDHVNPAGEQPWDRMARAGYPYRTAGENIAAGFALAADAVDAWLASDGHCANLMSTSYVDTGVGFYADPDATYQYYLTQTFGSSRIEE